MIIDLIYIYVYSNNSANEQETQPIVINSHMEASKIGRRVADQALEFQRKRMADSSTGRIAKHNIYIYC